MNSRPCQMVGGSSRAPVVAVLFLALAVSLPSVAAAASYGELVNPATSRPWAAGNLTLRYEINSGKVSRLSGGMTLQGSGVAFDTLATFRCAPQEQMWRATLTQPDTRWTASKSPAPGQSFGWRLANQSFAGVPLVTGAELKGACGRSSGAQMRIDFSLDARCTDANKQIHQRHEPAAVGLEISCADEKPAERTTVMKLSCPAGYWVSGTQDQEHVFEWTAPFRAGLSSMTCVRSGG